MVRMEKNRKNICAEHPSPAYPYTIENLISLLCKFILTRCLKEKNERISPRRLHVIS